MGQRIRNSFQLVRELESLLWMRNKCLLSSQVKYNDNNVIVNIKKEDESNCWQPFCPQYVHQLFGEKERINGYEGLSIDISFSSKRLIPLVSISYQKKAPAFANVDNLQEKLSQHFGRIYEDAVEFQTTVLKEEVSMKPKGEVMEEFQIKGVDYQLYQVCLDDESFREQSFYLQAILPFFIDGASVIEPCPFWKYYLIYEKATYNLVGFGTVYEAHQTAVKFRAKISQVLILPPFQGKGLGSLLYQKIYSYYKNNKPNCFQIIVEDSADEFQRIQDISNCKEYLSLNRELVTKIENQPASKVIFIANAVRDLELTPQNAKSFSTQLKLPEAIVNRIHELVIYSFLNKESEGMQAFREMVDKRFYKICVKNYITLFKSQVSAKNSSLSQPYIYNDLLPKDPFGLKIEEQEQQSQEGGKKEDVSADKLLVDVAAETQLKQMFDEQIEEFEQLKEKVRAILK